MKWLSPEDWLEDTKKASGSFTEDYKHHLILHVDGTVITVFSPADSRLAKCMYSHKHELHGWQFFITVTQTGRIVYLSSIQGGKLHDKTHWQLDKTSEKLLEFYRKYSYNNGELDVENSRYRCTIGGDKAYKGLQVPEGWLLLLTKSAERHDVEEEMNAHNHGPNPKPKPKPKPKPRSKPKPAPQEVRVEEVYDAGVATYRAVVERVMAALKRWRVLVTQYHLSNRNRAKKIIFVVACLTNYQLANDCSSNW